MAIAVFLTTMLLVILYPRHIGITALLGAATAWLTGCVDDRDIQEVITIVWDPTLAFVGIILLATAMEEIGFFDWAAIHMARLSRGDGRWLFVNMMLLGALVSAFFANDGAALILTPVILAKMRYLRLDSAALFAFVMAGGFIGDAASNPLVVSNLTNILTADYFQIGFLAYAKSMAWPNLAAVLSSIAILWLFFARDIPRRVPIERLPAAHTALRDRRLFRLAWLFLPLLAAGYIVGDIRGVPVSFLTLGGAVLFLVTGRVVGTLRPWATLRRAPWQIVGFSVGLYIVVWGLKNAGLTHAVADWIGTLHGYGEKTAIVGTGLIAATLSALMNNMPTVMIMDLAIGHTGSALTHTLAYANIVGCNIGPKMTPIGSLATLLWLHILARRGVHIGWRKYLGVGVAVTPPVLIVTLLALAFS